MLNIIDPWGVAILEAFKSIVVTKPLPGCFCRFVGFVGNCGYCSALARYLGGLVRRIQARIRYIYAAILLGGSAVLYSVSAVGSLIVSRGI